MEEAIPLGANCYSRKTATKQTIAMVTMKSSESVCVFCPRGDCAGDPYYDSVFRLHGDCGGGPSWFYRVIYCGGAFYRVIYYGCGAHRFLVVLFDVRWALL